MRPFSKASYLTAAVPESCPPEDAGVCPFVSAKMTMKDGQTLSASSFSSRYQLHRSFLPANVCVMDEIDWVGWGGGWGSRGRKRQRVPGTCPGIPGIPNSLICSGSRFPQDEVLPHLAAACLQPCMQRCVPDCPWYAIFFFFK